MAPLIVALLLLVALVSARYFPELASKSAVHGTFCTIDRIPGNAEFSPFFFLFVVPRNVRKLRVAFKFPGDKNKWSFPILARLGMERGRRFSVAYRTEMRQRWFQERNTHVK